MTALTHTKQEHRHKSRNEVTVSIKQNKNKFLVLQYRNRKINWRDKDKENLNSSLTLFNFNRIRFFNGQQLKSLFHRAWKVEHFAIQLIAESHLLFLEKHSHLKVREIKRFISLRKYALGRAWNCWLLVQISHFLLFF